MKTQVREIVESIPHETIQLKLFAPFTEFLNAIEFVPSHIRANLPPYHDILRIHYTGRYHLGGARAVEVGQAKRSSGDIGVEIAPPATKDERVFWISC